MRYLIRACKQHQRSLKREAHQCPAWDWACPAAAARPPAWPAARTARSVTARTGPWAAPPLRSLLWQRPPAARPAGPRRPHSCPAPPGLAHAPRLHIIAPRSICNPACLILTLLLRSPVKHSRALFAVGAGLQITLAQAGGLKKNPPHRGRAAGLGFRCACCCACCAVTCDVTDRGARVGASSTSS